MAKTRQKKQEIIKELVEKFKKAKSLVFVNFDGLTVKEVEELRKQCRQEKVDYLVTKKTLLKIALKEAKIEGVDLKNFKGGIATVFGYKDEVAPARIIENFSKNHEALKSLSGFLENKFIDKAKIIELSKLPTKDELLAKVVGSIRAPIAGLVNVLQGNLRNLIYVLNAIKKAK